MHTPIARETFGFCIVALVLKKFVSVVLRHDENSVSFFFRKWFYDKKSFKKLTYICSSASSLLGKIFGAKRRKLANHSWISAVEF
jgi:hypothetical protein